MHDEYCDCAGCTALPKCWICNATGKIVDGLRAYCRDHYPHRCYNMTPPPPADPARIEANEAAIAYLKTLTLDAREDADRLSDVIYQCICAARTDVALELHRRLMAGDTSEESWRQVIQKIS